MKIIENIALFDMDGTLFDFNLKMKEGLDKIRAPNEPEYTLPIKNDAPEYLRQRTYLIMSKKEWWANLPKFQLGWDVFEIAQDLEFKIKILTQCPKRNPDALAGKKMCIDKHLGYDFDITLTRNKGDVYGKVLVDDYPGYIQKWLKWRPRGLVIMPANNGNKDFKNDQVIRYDGTNLEEIREAMVLAKAREPGKTLEDMKRPKRVIIESPYAGDVETNVRYARACMRDCLLRGEFPYACHILYTQEGILNDNIPEERKLGMEAGLDWGNHADVTAVYTDLGISEGMEYGIERAKTADRVIEFRSLPDFNTTKK